MRRPAQRRPAGALASLPHYENLIARQISEPVGARMHVSPPTLPLRCSMACAGRQYPSSIFCVLLRQRQQRRTQGQFIMYNIVELNDLRTMAEKTECEIHFYGERGLVNGLFLDLRDAGRILEFLRKIQFAHREPPHLDPETKVLVIVEAGFAEFGCPDAILVVQTPDQKRLVFFVEAKAGRYEDNAQNYGQREPGFNSTINGQLSLRYRLACALRGFGKGQSRLEEPKSLATAYGEPNPRRLLKPGNLKHIVRRYLAGDSHYFFVALTDDKTNVWPAIETEKPELLPFLADESAPETIPWALKHNAWDRKRENFGWIGFCNIEPLVANGRYFRYARQFLDAKREAALRPARPTEARYENIRTKSWKDSSDRTIRLRDRLRLEIKQSTPVRDGQLRYKQEKGSDSVIDLRDQRVVKLITPVDGNSDISDKMIVAHSMTSSAMANSVGGTVMPSAFAVLRLITSSNLVGCMTGKSPGFSPLRIRPA
jgi:hypothetical protein